MDIHTNDDEDITADKSLSDFCDRFCFTNQISEPTRVTENSKTLIDIVLTSHPARYAKRSNLHLGVSDHDLVYVVIEKKQTPETETAGN